MITAQEALDVVLESTKKVVEKGDGLVGAVLIVFPPGNRKGLLMYR